MRQIKFRSWSKVTEKMSDWDFIKSVKNLHKLMSLNHIVLMPFTGLKDKNGNDIYSGDIFPLNGINMFVEYIDDRCCYVLTTGYGYDSRNCKDLNCDTIYGLEIIGNIHENPSLLK